MKNAVANPPDEETYPIIQEMLALSSALVTCMNEQNGVIFDLEDKTLSLFEKTGRLIETLAANPVFGDLRRVDLSLGADFGEIQGTQRQIDPQVQVTHQPCGVYYHRAPSAPKASSETDSLRSMYEATAKDMMATMGQTVQEQAQIGELRMQILVFAKDLLVTLLNTLAASLAEQNVTNHDQSSLDANHMGDDEPWPNTN
ncbi:MAG: hypothetical protein ETSY1_35045 [Candidatus Entotheonella factor]|uniref:Uncharacterized protein n=1 Tax=Entotheonella factor TaxID=1429438 RepID=W4LAR9_ENTF1|nr:MAG: hypothetical protein ETSY1_35045 [Candidatus Entotheonella factor]